MSQTKAQLIAPVGIVTTQGVVVTGVMTATSFTGDVVGSATSIISGSNLNLGTVTAGAGFSAFGGDFTGTATGIQTGAAIKVGVFTATSFTGDFTGTATSMMRGTGFEAGTVTSTAANVTYTITVGSKTGGGNAFYIDGVEAPVITLYPGATYTFDQADSTNGDHPLRLATAADAAGSTEYTDGVTVNGTQGTAGAYTRIVVSRTAPTPLYYYCTAHSGMGDSINITNQLQGNVTGNVTGSITGLAGSVTSGGNIHIGVITATSYSGDGSNMTGIAATNYNTQTVTANASETIIDLSDGNMITMNQSANTTVGFASTSTAMDITIIRVKDANDTARTITWPDSVNWNGGSAPTLINDSASGDSQQFQLITRDSGLTWYGWEPFAYDGPYTNSTLYTWGSNSYGMLGQNGNVPNYHGISSPTQIGSAEKWIPYASRDGHKSSQVNGAINMDGELWVFGDNRYGGLGQGDRTERSSPVQVDGTTWDSSCKFAYGFLARTTDGELWSWGNNQNGMLGLNQAGPNSISSPTQIPGTTWSKNINITATFANGVKTDGTMWMWGSSSSGSLGQNQGPGNNRSSPVQVGTDTTWATGYQKSSVTDSCICAVKTDGTLWSWGYSGTQGHGQSLNPNANRSSPIQIPGTTWDTVSGSYRGFGAVKTDGSLWVWGNNYYGQLGQNANGNPAARSSPMQIPGTTWSKISGDVNGYFALKTDGTAWAWGRSDKGQLGINNTTSYSSPVQIPGTDWTGVVSAGMAVLGYKDAT